MIVPKFLMDFFPKYLVLDLESICEDLLFFKKNALKNFRRETMYCISSFFVAKASGKSHYSCHI